MRNIPNHCIRETSDSIIKFQEKKSLVRFFNTKRMSYVCIQIDGCALCEGEKCDNALCSADGREERYVELKGSDVPHAINQLRSTIQKLGEHDDNRHSYIICTKVAPHITTTIQKAKMEFRKRYKSDLIVKESPVDVRL
ncbi:MAG: hypothetical protein SPG55_01790 [Prevotella sp.]|nr:hypothetical protein [Prevotella sp.]MDD7075368.1 hypothetical protein [Prevotellaceae bacterium]MDY5342929.1 hypothetical protein [Prevotella sp.]